jgi:hypothetical protein
MRMRHHLLTHSPMRRHLLTHSPMPHRHLLMRWAQPGLRLCWLVC